MDRGPKSSDMQFCAVLRLPPCAAVKVVCLCCAILKCLFSITVAWFFFPEHDGKVYPIYCMFHLSKHLQRKWALLNKNPETPGTPNHTYLWCIDCTEILSESSCLSTPLPLEMLPTFLLCFLIQPALLERQVCISKGMFSLFAKPRSTPQACRLQWPHCKAGQGLKT